MKTPKAGSGKFQWNTGGWFGSQIGSTLWLLLLGVTILNTNVIIGSILLFFFILPKHGGVAHLARAPRNRSVPRHPGPFWG